MPSQPTHLHSSIALAPTVSAIGLPDQDRPPIAKFLRSGFCTRHCKISTKKSTVALKQSPLLLVTLIYSDGVAMKNALKLGSLALTILNLTLLLPLANSADAIVIKETTQYTANISGVGSIWKGNIPKTIQFPLGNYSQRIEFPIEGILPYSVLADRATGTDVEFELWATSGKKIASTTVYSFNWNPVGPITLVSMSLSESDAIGNHIMIVRTIYELKTNGLLTSYLKQEDRFPIAIQAKKKTQTISVGVLKDRAISEGSFTLYSSDVKSSEYSLKVSTSSLTPNICEPNGDQIKLLGAGICTLSFSQPGNDTVDAANSITSSFRISGSRPSAISNLSASMVGQNLSYSFSKPVSSSPITKYEVAIQQLIRSGLPVTNYASYGPYSIIKTVYSENFSLDSAEIKNYLIAYQASDISNTSVMIRVITYNDLGASDLSNGIYTETSRFGWKADLPINKVTITCIKGKLTKKVTAVKPVCPVGYKKKV